MGGYFGIVSRKDCMLDVFFGVDYHSHLGTKRAGLASWDRKTGLQLLEYRDGVEGFYVCRMKRRRN